MSPWQENIDGILASKGYEAAYGQRAGSEWCAGFLAGLAFAMRVVRVYYSAVPSLTLTRRDKIDNEKDGR